MTSARQIAALTVLAATLAACGRSVQVSTQTAPNVSLATRSTFRILPTPRRRDGVALGPNDPMMDNSITNRALRDEVRSDLEARGYRPAGGGSADFDVAVYAAATQALDVQTYDYGYNWRGFPRERTDVSSYERGTVIVDVVDPVSHDVLWRGRGVAAVSDDPNKFEREASKEVDAILKKFPSR